MFTDFSSDIISTSKLTGFPLSFTLIKLFTSQKRMFVDKHPSIFYAVKCNLTELTTRSTSLAFAVSGLLDMRMCQDSSGAWSIGRCSSFVGVLAFSER